MITRASKREKQRAKIATLGITERNCPISPVARRRGVNAAILVSTVATTGQATSLVPITAALNGSTPLDIYLWTFSTTIMASSTTMPSIIIRPNIERTFSVVPVIFINMAAPRKETGIPRAAMKAALRSRKRARRINTRTNPRPPLLSMV